MIMQRNGQVNIKIPAPKFIKIIAPEVLQGGNQYATVKVHQAHPVISPYQNGAGRARMSRAKTLFRFQRTLGRERERERSESDRNSINK